FNTINNGTTVQNATLNVTATQNGCTSAAKSISIIVNPRPQISVNSPSICAGDSAILSVIGNADTYTWSPTTGLKPATGSTIKASPSVTTTYTVTAAFTATTCQNTTQGTVTVKTIPAKPTITFNGNQLISSSSTGNQWSLNGTIISGETNQSINPLQSGLYSVIITTNGCSSPLSDPYNYIVTSQNEFSENEFIKINPNQIKNDLVINFNFNNLRTLLNLKIYGSNGELLKSIQHLKSGQQILTSGLPKGQLILWIELTETKRRFIYKLIKI
ncbi:MAG: hypothetical protein ACK55K_00740, partial [Bacteroidota bacterium]